MSPCLAFAAIALHELLGRLLQEGPLYVPEPDARSSEQEDIARERAHGACVLAGKADNLVHILDFERNRLPRPVSFSGVTEVREQTAAQLQIDA